MKIKTIIGLSAGLLVSAGCCICSLGKSDYPETIEEGFVSLFNGRDLTGWTGATSVYGVDQNEPGVLRNYPDRQAPKGLRSDLYTIRSYTNFVLRFEFMLSENGNNGLGIRMVPNQDAAYFGMCELQLLDDGGSEYYDAATKTDKLKPYQYTGSIYGIVPSLRDNVDKQIHNKDKLFTGGGSYVRKPGMWNFAEVKVIGSEIEYYLNGYLITKGDVSKYLGNGDTPDGREHPGLHNVGGPIGWLGHGSLTKWKNIRILELPADAKMGAICPKQTMKCPKGFTPYFTGEASDFKNWKGVTTAEGFDNPIVRNAASAEKRAEMQSLADDEMINHWLIRNGNLYFDGYKGGYSLATARDFGDFEMWADWRIMSITGDSGLYLRGAPQVQIWDAHNQWKIGSGGLYNNAKNPSQALVIADKQVGDWNRFHVIMRDAKVSVWLNGECVVDNVTLENYWDRNLPIFECGQIELQCHGDPIEWRNIFIRELPESVKIDASRVGVCSWSYHRPIREVVKEMEKAKIKGLHLALGPFMQADERHGDAETKETWEWLKERVDYGQVNVMSTMVSMLDEDYTTLETIRKTGGIVPDHTWRKNKKVVEKGAKLTHELGCKYMSLHAGFIDEKNPAAFEKCVKRMKELRNIAKKYGVTLILESGQETAEELAKFLDAVDGVYANFDPANMILYGKGCPMSAIETVLPWVKQIHVKDAIATAKPGEWGTEVKWGMGQVGGKAFVTKLEELGYRGNYVIEREGGEDRVNDIFHAKERITK